MIELILLLGILLTVGFAIIVAQIVALARIFKSRAWVFVAGGFVVLAARTLWSFLKLPAAVIKAIGDQRMPENLTLEQWIMTGTVFVMIALFIAGFDTLRQNLRAVGV